MPKKKPDTAQDIEREAAKANISEKELAALKQRAKTRLSMTDEQLTAALKAGILNEIAR
jgi:hypothetical protein